MGLFSGTWMEGMSQVCVLFLCSVVVVVVEWFFVGQIPK